MTPEGQMCRDMLGDLESQWERAGPLVKLQGQEIIPPMLMLFDSLCDRLDAVEAVAHPPVHRCGKVVNGYVCDLQEGSLCPDCGPRPARVTEEQRATGGQCDSLADLEARHG